MRETLTDDFSHRCQLQSAEIVRMNKLRPRLGERINDNTDKSPRFGVPTPRGNPQMYTERFSFSKVLDVASPQKESAPP